MDSISIVERFEYLIAVIKQLKEKEVVTESDESIVCDLLKMNEICNSDELKETESVSLIAYTAIYAGMKELPVTFIMK